VAIAQRHSGIGEHWFGGWHALRNQGLKRCEGTVIGRLVLLALTFAFLMPQSIAEIPVTNVRRVLILNIFNPLSSQGVAALDQAIIERLERSPYQIELYSEDFGATLFPGEASQKEIREWYIHKYHDRKPDVIVAVGPEPLRFLVESHEKTFRGVPVIFCGSTEEMLGKLKLSSDFTGVWGVAQPEKTLIAALHMRPSTRHGVVLDLMTENLSRLRWRASAVIHQSSTSLISPTWPCQLCLNG
jgi:hypothetical protein